MTIESPHTQPVIQSSPGPQGRVLALKRFVDSLIGSLPERAGATEDQFGLVYLGNVHDAIPRLLILDQGLRLEERCVWQVMRINITDPGRPASLLTQQQLAAQCGVDIKTLRGYLHALRANRWISHCVKVHKRGTIWALHDEPLSLADTVVLDPDYMPFIHGCAQSNVKRLRHLGNAVLQTLSSEIAQGHDYSQPVTQLEQMAQRMTALEHVTAPNHPSPNPTTIHAGSFFAISQQLTSDREIRPVKNTEVIHNREIFPVTAEKFSTEEKSPCVENFPVRVRGSSNYLNKKHKDIKNTTTTTKTNLNPSNTPTREEKFSAAEKFSETKPTHPSQSNTLSPHPDWVAHLQWPLRLKEAERLLVLPALTASDFDTAQYLLNYLADRLQAASRGDARPVSNPVAYLIQLAALHAEGKLLPSSWGVRKSKPTSTEAPTHPTDSPAKPISVGLMPGASTTADVQDKIEELKRKMKYW